jgi:N-methylhydantoinase B
VVREYEILDGEVSLSHRGERHFFSAPGLDGGSEGAKAYSVIRHAGGGEDVIPSKMVTTLRKGDRLVIETAGGGGYGDPHGRPAEHVREDVRNGKVSEEAARSVYGQARQR